MKNVLLLLVMFASSVATASTTIRVESVDTLTQNGSSSSLPGSWTRGNLEDVEVNALYETNSYFYYKTEIPKGRVEYTCVTNESWEEEVSGNVSWSRHQYRLDAKFCSGWELVESGQSDAGWYKVFSVSNMTYYLDQLTMNGGPTSTLQSQSIKTWRITITKSSGMPLNPEWLWVEEPPAASVVELNGKYGFATVTEAINSIAEVGQTANTLVLLTNVYENISFVKSCQVTMDLNGHDLVGTNKDSSVIKVGANVTLTLQDSVGSGKVTMLATVTADRGGAVRNDGTLYLDRVTLADCVASRTGGGIHNSSTGYVEINGVMITNCASVSGGAINNVDGEVVIWDVTIADCSSTLGGGGIRSSGELTIYDGLIVGCEAMQGGGLNNDGTVYMMNGMVKGCAASLTGGGIYNTGSFLLVHGVVADCANPLRGCVVGNRGSFEMMGGVFSNCVDSANGCAVLNEEGSATYRGEMVFAMSGGSIEGGKDNQGVAIKSKSSLRVTGGRIKNEIVVEEGTCEISGGSFGHKVAPDMLAASYACVPNEDSSTSVQYPYNVKEAVSTSEAPVACDWLQKFYPTASKDEYGSLVNTVGVNGCKVWESYMLNLDPTNETSKLCATIIFEDGKPVVHWEPDSARLQTAGYEYVTYGCESLGAGSWVRVNGDASCYKFFKVSVEPKP